MRTKKGYLVGRKFGLLTIIELLPWGKCQCLCACGETTVKMLGNVESGNTSSCGCSKQRWITEACTTHGEAGASSKTPEYHSWSQMLVRCENEDNPNYPHWGGRGISVCERWHRYEDFLADMGRKPSPRYSIDRIDNNGNYEPGNCRWANPFEQARNTRRSRFVVAFGKSRTIREWSDFTGIAKSTIFNRLRLGWSTERALTQ